MPRASSLAFAIVVLALLRVAPAAAQTVNNDRITEPVEASQAELVLGSVHPLVQAEFDQGPVPESMLLHHVSIVFRLSDAQQEALDQLLAEQQDPSSPNYHKWLTPDQYGDRFGLTPNDVSEVSSWLKSQGLTVESVSRSRTEIFFGGTAAQIAAGLRTEIHRYVINGESHFANVTEPSVPSDFAGMVQGFRNLDDFRPKSRIRVAPRLTSSITGNHFLAPGDFATIYDLQPLYAAGYDGTGVSIGVVGDSAITLSDIDAFRAAAGLPANDPTIVTVPGTGVAVHNSDEVEADLDIEWSGGVAKKASIIYYVAGQTSQNAFDALDYAITGANPLAPVISNSFGNCEANIGSAFAETTLRGWIKQANTQGQTVTSAAGDTGAADCDSQSATVGTLGPSVDLPAGIPEVTGVGGSEFTGDPAGALSGGCALATTYWSGSCTTTSGASALSYIPEMAWNDGPSPGTGAFTTLAAGGGGASTFFTKAEAPWQTGITPAGDNQRDVPDVTLSASPAHDPYLICSQAYISSIDPGATSCTSGFRDSNQNFGPIGGTSAGAPTMAGILAIINQATKSGLGNANLTLYALFTSTPTAFHAIAPPPTSSNIVPCQKGTTGCPASSPFQYGFKTAAGYDKVTGLGSLDAYVLTCNWPGFTLAPQVATTATVASNHPSANAGTSVTFTATITTSGAACPPIGGTVQFTSDGTNLGTPPAAVSNGVATFSTTTLAVGTHQIAADYLGDTSYLASTSPAITQTITVAPDYSISSPSPTSLTLSPGASGTATLNIAAAGAGFTGTVNLTCAPSSLTAEISCSLSPASIPLSSSTTSGQTTLTVKTRAPVPPSVARGSDAMSSWMAASGGALFAGVLLIGVAPRRRSASMVCLVLLAFLSAGVGCGGSSGGGSNPGNPGTPAGPYTITVTATSSITGGGSGPTHTSTLQLTVP